MPRRFRAPEEPNGASVVTSVRLNDVAVMLGGDLENSENPNTGWTAVIREARQPISGREVLPLPRGQTPTLGIQEGILTACAPDHEDPRRSS
jgi:hypothetical protein